MKKLKDYLLENYVKENGDLDIRGLDLSDFDGDVYIGEMKVKGNLSQSFQKVNGHLYQSSQKVKGYLYQDDQKVEGNLYQDYQKVEGDLRQSYQEVEGNLRQNRQKVEGNLFQNFQKVKGNLHQDAQKVKGILWDDKPKIELSIDEVIILKNLDKRYKYIARNEDGDLNIYGGEPDNRDTHYYHDTMAYFENFRHLFQNITFESGPHLIADLIEENEK